MIVRALFASCSAFLLTSCQPAVPGESVGTYKITMALKDNACGPMAVYLEDGKRFSAEVRADGSKGYWRVPDLPLLEGTYDEGSFAFTQTGIVATGDLDAGMDACRLVQTTVLKGTIDGLEASTDAGASGDGGQEGDDASETTFRATYTLTISAEPGADCAEALMPAGPYAKLPCVVRYSLSGEERSSF